MPPRRRPRAAGATSTNPTNRITSYLDPFLAYLKAECGLSRNSVSAYHSDVNRFIEWCLGRELVSVHAIGLQDFSAYLRVLHESNLSPTSVARHLVSIKMLFRYLVLEGVIADSAVDLLNSPKLWQKLPKVLSSEQVDRLLQAPTADDRLAYRDRALLTVLYATGCRASEVSGLRLQDVHLEEAYCRCFGKGSKERIVSLNPVAVSAIEAYLSAERATLCRENSDDWLFLTRSGQQVSRVMIWKIVKKYARRIGCSGAVSPHTMRHSFATHMLSRGAEIRALQELLGHASIATTQLYTRVEHSRLKAVHERCHPRG